MSFSKNNKRIAKNTLMLYGRMLLMVLVSLYTSRVVLSMLGVKDFGIYSVVGGFVIMFSFLNNAMSAATQRFLSFELGHNDKAQAGRVFGMSLLVHFCISAFVFLLAETVGLWFLNTKLNIPGERMWAANWVYQFSVAATLVGIIRVPYNATIIAYERMSLFAYLGIGEALSKLTVAFLLVLSPFDRLVFFSSMIFVSLFLTAAICIGYCYWVFESARHRLYFEKKLFHEMLSFSGWSLFGGFAYICNTQGINVVINIFCGVAANAAMGVANQVNNAIYRFVTSFQTAFSPQIVKYYAAAEKEAMNQLVFRASKISFFLMLFLSLPIIANVNFILRLWIKVVPDYSPAFVSLTLVYCLVDSLSMPINTMVNATGKIKPYKVIVGTFYIFNVPLAFWLLSLGLRPEWVLVSRVAITCLLQPVRLFIAKHVAGFPIHIYCQMVLFKVFGVLLCSAPVVFFIAELLSGWVRFFVSLIYSSLSIVLSCWFIGLSTGEREKLIVVARQKLGTNRKMSLNDG